MFTGGSDCQSRVGRASVGICISLNPATKVRFFGRLCRLRAVQCAPCLRNRLPAWCRRVQILCRAEAVAAFARHVIPRFAQCVHWAASRACTCIQAMRFARGAADEVRRSCVRASRNARSKFATPVTGEPIREAKTHRLCIAENGPIPPVPRRVKVSTMRGDSGLVSLSGSVWGECGAVNRLHRHTVSM